MIAACYLGCTALVETMRVDGEQHGELPAWLCCVLGEILSWLKARFDQRKKTSTGPLEGCGCGSIPCWGSVAPSHYLEIDLARWSLDVQHPVIS
jgi:hypothetical protein